MQEQSRAVIFSLGTTLKYPAGTPAGYSYYQETNCLVMSFRLMFRFILMISADHGFIMIGGLFAHGSEIEVYDQED